MTREVTQEWEWGEQYHQESSVNWSSGKVAKIETDQRNRKAEDSADSNNKIWRLRELGTVSLDQGDKA